MITLDHGFEGPFKSGYYSVRFGDSKAFKVGGKEASMIALLLTGYKFSDDFQPLSAFGMEEIAAGQQALKVADHDG